MLTGNNSKYIVYATIKLQYNLRYASLARSCVWLLFELRTYQATDHHHVICSSRAAWWLPNPLNQGSMSFYCTVSLAFHSNQQTQRSMTWCKTQDLANA